MYIYKNVYLYVYIRTHVYVYILIATEMCKS